MSTSNQEEQQEQVQNQEQEQQLTVVDASFEENTSDNKKDENDDDQTVTEEERQWMINDVKEKTKGLQDLLIKYRQMEDDLKEEVMEMVLRDIHEQNIHIGINKRVQTAQQEMLSDTAYVGWAMKHGKGEFAEKASTKKKTPEESKSTTSNDEGENDGNKSATPHSWKDNIVDAVASVALKNKNQEGDTNTKEESPEENDAEVASLPDATILASSLPLSTLVLPPRIALVLSSSFQSLQDKESSMPELLKARFHSFLTLVEVWKQRVEAHNNGEPCAICLNGIPLLLGNQQNLLSGDRKNTLVSSSSSSSSCEENVSSVINMWLERTNNTTTKEIIHDIFSTESDSSREFFNALLKHGTNSDELMPTSVAGSSNDTLSLVPLKQLQNSLLVYAVASQKSSSSSQVQVAAIEPVISSFALHLAKGFSTQSSIRQQVDTFCQQMIGPLMASKVIPKRCVLTLALSSSSSSSKSSSNSVTNNNSTVVLDIAELNPHLPTSLLSWGDVCSILRQQQQPQNDFSCALSSTTNTNTGSSNFLFRGQKSRIANLEESIRNEKEEEEENGNDAKNTTSSKTVARCFLQLVENCLNFDQDQDQDIKTAETKDQKNESSSSSSSLPLPVVGASVAAGIGLAAYFLLKKNNQSN